MCEQLEKEPDPNEMPVTEAMFPLEVQQAFYVFSLMPDKWEGMAGSYMGKDWSALPALLSIYDIEDKKTVTMFFKHIELEAMSQINKEQKRKQDAEMRRAKAKR